MKLATRVASCILLIAAVFLNVAESRRRCPVLHAASGSQKTGCYIIVLKEATSAEDFQEVLAKVVKVADSAKVYGMVQRIAKAFTVKLTSYALHSVRNVFHASHALPSPKSIMSHSHFCSNGTKVCN